MDALNGREARIAEETVSAIDFMSRLVGAIEDGNWYYAADKLSQLTRTLEKLSGQLARTDHPAVGPPVAAYVAEQAQQYRIGRGLYGRANRRPEAADQSVDLDAVEIPPAVAAHVLRPSRAGVSRLRQGVQPRPDD
jgi:hypothetical protein